MKTKLLYLLFFIGSVQLLSAATFMVDGINYNTLSDTEVEVIALDSDVYKGLITINSSVINGTTTYSVIAIGEYAFSNSQVESIILPDGLKFIRSYAFHACYGLRGITFSDSVTIIGDNAFSFCPNLNFFNIPSNLKTIGDGAFWYCSRINNFVIPESVTSIGNMAFRECENLANITLPSKITSINEGLFDGCESLTNISIPETVTSIGAGAFEGCSSLEIINLPESVTSIGNWAFSNCWGISEFNIKNDGTPISIYNRYVFSGVTISSITLVVPVGTKEIYESTHVWQDFGTIIEDSTLSTEELSFKENFSFDISQNNIEIQSKTGVTINKLKMLSIDGQIGKQ